MAEQNLNLSLKEKVFFGLSQMQSFLKHRKGFVFPTSSKIGACNHHPALDDFIRRVIVMQRIIQGLFRKRYSLLNLFPATLTLNSFRLRKIDVGEIVQVGSHVQEVTVFLQLAHHVDALGIHFLCPIQFTH